MKELLECPEAVIQAKEAQRGKHWLVELLVFVALFVICTLGQLLILLPIELVLIYTNADYQAAAETGDAQALMEVSARIAGSDIYTILALFSTVAMLLIAILFCRGFQKRSMAAIGFTKGNVIKEYLMGAGAGFLFITAATVIGVATGAMRFEGISETFAPLTILLFLFGFLIQGMAEEVLCRGYLMVSVARRYPLIAAVLINSLVFAMLHGANAGLSPLALINLALFGIFASVCFIKRGNIWGIGAFHSIWNFAQGNIYGIQVSGMPATTSVFAMTSNEGMDILNGGAFGLEGSIAVTIVYAAGILFLLLRGRKEN